MGKFNLKLKSETFFVLNNHPTTHLADKVGCSVVFFYKRSKDASVAALQDDFFTRLIEKGLKQNIQHFLIVNVDEHKSRLLHYLQHTAVKSVVLYGVQESDLGIHILLPLYQLVPFSDWKFIKADAPEVIDASNALKAKLWTPIQQLFL